MEKTIVDGISWRFDLCRAPSELETHTTTTTTTTATYSRYNHTRQGTAKGKLQYCLPDNDDWIVFQIRVSRLGIRLGLRLGLG